MHIRRYSIADADAVYRLFADSVWHLCAADYSPEELSAWTGEDVVPEIWAERFSSQYSLVAVDDDGTISGFVSADASRSYLDMLYVSSSAAGHGVGSTLLKAAEAVMTLPVTVHASLTARGFFRRYGYETVRENTVVRHGTELQNCIMRKE